MNPVVASQLGMRMTTDELANAIGVDASTISNWRRRKVGFPRGRRAGGVLTYSFGEVLTWLSAREIPKRQRRASDGPTNTYGARLSHFLSAAASQVVLRDVDELPLGAMSQLDSLYGRHFGPIGVTRADVLDAALVLTFTWITSQDEWKAIESANGRLDTITVKVDQVLRRFGFVISAGAVLRPLWSGNGDSLKRLVGQCNCLGIKGFEAILTVFAGDFGGTSETYRTPREVAELMGACAVPIATPLKSVADLHNRHGELVLAVPTTPGEEPPVVYAVGNDPAAAWRTQMHLIVRGRAGTAVPGGVPWRSRQRAETFDAVVTNPPFNRALGFVQKHFRWEYGSPPPHNSNMAWVQAALAATSEHGRAVVLMPVSEGGDRADRRSEEPRRKLVDSGALRAIVRLSSDLFPASSVDTTVWVLERPRTDRSGIAPIVFVDATQLKHKESERFRPRLVGMSVMANLIRTSGSLVPGEIRELSVEVGNRRATGRAVAVPVSEVVAQGYLLAPHTYLGPVVEKGDAHLRRIQSDSHAAEDARKRVIELPTNPITMVKRELVSAGLPAGWEAVRLGDFCDIKVGPSKLKKSDLTHGDDGVVPVLRPSNLQPRRIITDEMLRTPSEKAAIFSDWRVEADDLLLVRVGPVERAAIASPEHHGWLIDSNLTRLRVDPKTIVPRFLLEFLLRGTSINQIRAAATVNVAPSMSGSKLADFVVTLPPLTEQAEIVEILVEQERRTAALREAMLAEERLQNSLTEGLTAGAVGPYKPTSGSSSTGSAPAVGSA
ncbi:N-6 DNA methylase [Nocardia sp. NPDC005825]|uniref:N-6 DNA methylase n=1 Tax=unclassified Nocardia TaxID=2637762 RepID=UPI0033EBCACE